MLNRERLVYIYLIFILCWYAGILLAIKYLGLNALEAVGAATAGGVFLGAFKDMWQFLWRKAGPGDKPEVK